MRAQSCSRNAKWPRFGVSGLQWKTPMARTSYLPRQCWPDLCHPSQWPWTVDRACPHFQTSPPGSGAITLRKPTKQRISLVILERIVANQPWRDSLAARLPGPGQPHRGEKGRAATQLKPTGYAMTYISTLVRTYLTGVGTRLAQGGVNRSRVGVENEAPLHVIAHDQTGDNHNGQGGTAEDQSEDTESAAVGHWVDSCSPHFLREYAQTTPKVRGVADFLAATFTTPPRCRGDAAGPFAAAFPGGVLDAAGSATR